MALVVGMATAGLLVVTGSVSVVQGARKLDAVPHAEVVAALQSASSRTVLNPDGTYTTTLYGTPVNYRDAHGDWQHAAPRFGGKPGAGYKWAGRGAGLGVELKQHASDAGLIHFTTGALGATLSASGAKADALGKASGDQTVTYADAYTDTELQYTVSSDALKESIVLGSADAPSTFAFVLRPDDGAKLTAVPRRDGSIAFLAENSATPAFVLAAPTVADSSVPAGVSAKTVAKEAHDPLGRAANRVGTQGRYKVGLRLRKLAGGTFSVTVRVDPAWLHDPARVFPVVVDPTITTQADVQDATYPTAPGTSLPDVVGPVLSVGTDQNGTTFAAPITFDLASLPPGAKIENASMQLYWTGCLTGGSCPTSATPAYGGSVQAQRLTAGWSSTTPWSAITPDSTVLGSFALNVNSAADQPSGFRSISGATLASTVQSMVNGAVPNYGFLLTETGSAPAGFTFAGSRYPDFADAPRLTVQWTADGVQLYNADHLHADGPELSWQHYSGGLGPYAQTILADAPTAYWRFDDAAGSPFGMSDWTGNAQNATGAASAYGEPGATADGDGSAYFDSTTQVEAAGGPQASLGNTFTLEAWVKRASTTSALQTIFSRGADGSNGGFRLQVTTGNTLELGYGDTDGNGSFRSIAQSTTTIGDTSWHYVVATKSGSDIHLYIDGIDRTNTTTVSDATVGSGLGVVDIGAATGTNGVGRWWNARWNGWIDEPAVYSTALSATQVAAHYAAASQSIAGFQRFEIHRSTTSGFTPSPATLIATIADPAFQSYSDTTAKAGGTFYYRVVTVTAAGTFPSNEVSTTLPADGDAEVTIQPGVSGGVGKATTITNGSSCNLGGSQTITLDASNRGLVQFDLRSIPPNATVDSATLSLFTFSPSAASIEAQRITSDWTEGAGTSSSQCDASGATWASRSPSVAWSAAGGDVVSTPVATVSDPGGNPHWDTLDVTSAVQSWLDGSSANFGLLLRHATETGAPSVAYASNDYTTSIALRPKLTVTYSDDSHANAPVVSIGAPAPNKDVSGTVTVAAGATDDGRVAQVQFLLDGDDLGSPVTAPPFHLSWDTTTAARGAHTLAAVATDDAGNTTTSAAVPVTVRNSSAPVTAVTGATSTGSSWTFDAMAADDIGVTKVDFLVDGFLVGSDDASPYELTVDSLDVPIYDGDHTLTTRAYDEDGNATTSSGSSFTVANTDSTEYQGTISPLDVPLELVYDPSATTQASSRVSVELHNTSAVDWSASSVSLRYRWLAWDGSVLSSSSDVSLGSDLPAGDSRTLDVDVTPPTPPDGVARGRYTLRFDLYDSSGSTYFADEGNEPADRTVTVTSLGAGVLGLERFESYDGVSLGAAMSGAVNLADGDLAIQWTPSTEPGIGLNTVASLSYDSLQDGSVSPIGNNWSLSVSGLTPFGLPLDIHPNAADTASGRSDAWVGFADADGTYHRFVGRSVGGSTVYDAPAGVHLYLRPTGQSGAQAWAVTQPDRTTFYFDDHGYPTSVVDGNGNALTYTETPIAAADSPYGLTEEISSVTDQGGRSFDLHYFHHDDTTQQALVGKLKSFSDHMGHTYRFSYYDDGNLLAVTEDGGANADGSYLADRTITFDYTNPAGTAPAISSATARRTPDPATEQSTKLYSVVDPRGNETTFSYVTTAGADKWRLASVTPRSGQNSTVSYAYPTATTTTVVKPPAAEQRLWAYTFDSTGRVTSMVDPLHETTTISWTADDEPSTITEPTGKTVRYAYNANGYQTDKWDELGDHSSIAYENLPVDSSDTSANWPTGRTIPHLSRPVSVTKPNGNVGADTANGAVGTIVAYSGVDTPNGWLELDGSPQNRTTQAALFAVIGTTYGNGDGSTTFNLPDARGRAIVGLGTNGDVSSVGQNDGAAVGSRTPYHTHSVSFSLNRTWYTNTDPGSQFAGSQTVSSSRSTGAYYTLRYLIKADASAPLPVGAVVAYAGNGAVPDGWVTADGSLVSRSTYPALFTVDSSIYSNGDGSTNFGVPDVRGRFVVGRGTNGDDSSMAQNEGVAVGSRTPLHTHSASVSATRVCCSDTNPGSEHVGSETIASSSNGPAYITLRYLAKASPAASLTSGMVLPFAASSVPAGFLAADGSNVSRSQNAALFSALGGTYGSGDGSTTFAVPDVRGRIVVGQGTNGDDSSLGENDGLAVGSRSPLHTHNFTFTAQRASGKSSDPGHDFANTQTFTSSKSGGAYITFPYVIRSSISSLTTFGYQDTSHDLVTSITDPLGNVEHATYNSDGSIATQTLPANGDGITRTTTYDAYDANGLPTQVTDAAGNVSYAGYRADGKLLWTQDADHQSFTGSTTLDPSLYRTEYGFDAFGRVDVTSSPKSTKYEPGLLIWTDTSYDPNDNVVAATAAHYGAGDSEVGATTATEYDAMDRKTLVTGPRKLADGSHPRTLTEYDDAGRVVSVTKPNGMETAPSGTAWTKDGVTETSYDALDRVAKTTSYAVDGSGNVDTSKMRIVNDCYDLAGDLRSVTGPKGASTFNGCPSFAPSYAQAVLSDNPYAYWRFGEASGSCVGADTSGHGHTVALCGINASPGAPGALTNDANTALAMNGGYADAPIEPSIYTNFTVEMWVKLNSVGSGEQFLFLNGNTHSNGYALEVNTNGHLGLYLWQTSTPSVDLGYAPPLHQWVHLALTNANGAYKLYANGTLVYNNGNLSNPLQPNGTPGNSGIYVGAFLDATIDEAALYPAALSQARIQTHYATGIGTAPYVPNATPYTTTFTYDAAHRQIAQTAPDGTTTSTSYDLDGNTLSTTDQNGKTTTFTYDQRDQKTSETDPFDTGRTITQMWQYDALGNLQTYISPRAYDSSSDKVHFASYTTTYAYDALNRQIKTIVPMAPYTYAQQVINDHPWGYWRLGETPGSGTAADASGNGRSMSIESGTTSGVAGALPADTNTALALNGLELSGPVQPSIATTFTFEAWVKLNALRSGEQFVFFNANPHSNGFGLALSASEHLIIERWNKTPEASDTGYVLPLHAWEHIALTNASGVFTLYINGIAVFSADLGGVNTPSGTSGNSALEFGQNLDATIDEAAVYTTPLTQAQIQAHVAAAQGTAYSHVAYDANGNPTMVSLPSLQSSPSLLAPSEQTLIDYWDSGTIYSEQDPATPKVRFDYTAEGQQSSRIPEVPGHTNVLDLSRAEYWDYTPDGLERALRDLGGERAFFTYDADGNQTGATEATGITQATQSPLTIQNSFDGFDELIKTRTPKQGVAGTWMATSYSYDLDGMPTGLVDNAEEDNSGAQTALGRSYAYTFNSVDQLTQETDDFRTPSNGADDERVTYTYTPSGLLDQRNLYKSDGSGGWTQEQLTARSYYDNGLAKGLTTYGPTNAVLEQHSLGYIQNGVYVDGNRTSDSFQRAVPSGTSAPCSTSSCTATWSYDARNRLTYESDGAGGGIAYTLDPVGNITQQFDGGGTTLLTYNGQQLATKTAPAGTTTRFIYDSDGNADCSVSAGWSAATCPAPGSTGLLTDDVYDYNDRLAHHRAYDGNGALTDSADYVDDPLDRQVNEVETHGGITTTTASTYIGISNAVSTDIVAGGTNMSKTYSYDAYGTRLTIAETPTGGSTSRYSFVYDQQLNVSMLIDQTGTIKAADGYTAYGSTDAALTRTASGFDSATNPYRYSDKRFDPSSNTYDMGARQYSPQLMHWTQRDIYANSLANFGLALDPLTSNRYAFVGANPIGFVEVDGHMLADLNGNQERGLEEYKQVSYYLQQLPGSTSAPPTTTANTMNDNIERDEQALIDAANSPIPWMQYGACPRCSMEPPVNGGNGVVVGLFLLLVPVADVDDVVGIGAKAAEKVWSAIQKLVDGGKAAGSATAAVTKTALNVIQNTLGEAAAAVTDKAVQLIPELIRNTQELSQKLSDCLPAIYAAVFQHDIGEIAGPGGEACAEVAMLVLRNEK